MRGPLVAAPPTTVRALPLDNTQEENPYERPSGRMTGIRENNARMKDEPLLDRRALLIGLLRTTQKKRAKQNGIPYPRCIYSRSRLGC